jgi:two-component system, sensor histidine kinase LadS
MRAILLPVLLLSMLTNLRVHGQPQDSILVIRQIEETFPLNRFIYIFKDSVGDQSFDNPVKNRSAFVPLRSEHFLMHDDLGMNAFWMRTYIHNAMDKPLRYVFYSSPNIDTIEIWVKSPDGVQTKSVLSSLTPTYERPLRVAQELCMPLTLQPGMTELILRLPNKNTWNQQLGSFIGNLAEETTFVNYFLKARAYQGIALGIIGIMLIFHFAIYLFFRDKTSLLFVVNLFFTIAYLITIKHFHEELPFLSNWLVEIRYLRNPLGLMVCITSLTFAQSFLNTVEADRLMHKVMNWMILFSCLVLICMLSLQFLWLMEIMNIYVAIISFMTVLITSIRVYKNGNSLALYMFFGFLTFFLSALVFVFPLSYTDYRSNESDYHFIAEGFRAAIFAIGVADRFKRLRQSALQAESEKNQMILTKELQLQQEKDRIRRELHDSLGSQLSTISISLSRISMEVKSESLNAIQSLADKAITELRDSLWILNKKEITIDELGQRINSIFWYYRKMEVQMEMVMEIHGNGDEKLGSSVAGNLFRITQEAVQNAVKHSEASVVRVIIQNENNFLKLLITDDGKGFGRQKPLEQEHYGLHNMQKRAEQLNSEMTIDSTPDKGTIIALKIDIGIPKQINL